MKLVKSTSWRIINTTIDGKSLSIGQEAIVVEDSIATKLAEQFLHEVSVEDLNVENEVVAPQETESKIESDIDPNNLIN